VKKVRSALSAIDGVEVKSVSKTAAEVTVDTSKVKNEALIKAVTDAGYSATID
jgi:copper chaperone CopZ